MELATLFFLTFPFIFFFIVGIAYSSIIYDIIMVQPPINLNFKTLNFSHFSDFKGTIFKTLKQTNLKPSLGLNLGSHSHLNLLLFCMLV